MAMRLRLVAAAATLSLAAGFRVARSRRVRLGMEALNGETPKADLVPYGGAGAQAPQLVTFDATGTLMRLRASEGLLYRDALLRHFGDVRLPRPDAFQEALDKAYDEQCVRQPCFGCGAGIASEEWWLTVMETTYKNVLSSSMFSDTGSAWAGDIQVDASDKTMQDVYADLYYNVFGGAGGNAGAWELRPDAELVLQSLKTDPASAGVCVGVVSNFDERLCGILEQLGIAQYVDFVVASRLVGQEKPSRVVFDLAMQRARAIKGEEAVEGPHMCLHIGDSFRTDVEGAHNAGWKSMLLMTGPPDTDELIDSIETGHNMGIDYRTVGDLWPVLETFGIPLEERAFDSTGLREEHLHEDVGYP